jgi:transmembrane sensor
MSEVTKLPTLAGVEEEAVTWIWRLDAETATAEDRQALEAWLRRDARHRRAYSEFERLWRGLDNLSEAKRPEKIATFTAAPPRRAFGRPLAWVAALAAMLLVVVGVTVRPSRDVTSEVAATAVGQQRTVTFADRSVVTLNTNTIVETHFAPSVRDVYLRKGEAHFAVAHDRARPFLVHAGDAVVRAVGTEFDVRVRSANQVEVLVNEGRVEVQTTEPAATEQRTQAPKPGAHTVRVLAAGERLRTGTPGLVVQNVSIDDVAQTMAWRQGAVVFEGQTLSEAIAELSRYTDSRFVVSDPRITSLPVGGRFKTDDVSGFLSALEKALPVSVRRAPDGVVYIEPRS